MQEAYCITSPCVNIPHPHVDSSQGILYLHSLFYVYSRDLRDQSCVPERKRFWVDRNGICAGTNVTSEAVDLYRRKTKRGHVSCDRM